MHWLTGSQSKLSLEKKLLLYKTILKPVWTYEAQLWGTPAISNIAIIQRYQSKILRMITRAPWYISKDQIHKELNIPTVEEEVQNIISNYKTRISNHPNPTMCGLLSLTFSGGLYKTLFQ